jgi:YesN/AraC family two-component response regulator
VLDRKAAINTLSNYSILFVDDDTFVLDMVGRIYGRYFKEVFLAQDGCLGLEAYKAHKPDIVVTDVTMPISNGIEMATAIKNINENLKIIFATGHNEKEYLSQFAKFGGYTVTKPINTEVLLDMLYGLLCD